MTQKEINEKILAMPGKRREVAYHEAAHFVIYVVGCKKFMEFPHVERISIAAEESHNLGYIRHRPLNIIPDSIPGLIKQLPGEEAEWHKEKILVDIRYRLAGPASDFIVDIRQEYGQNLNLFFDLLESEEEDDLTRAFGLFTLLNESNDYWDLLPLMQQTVEEVRTHWRHVQKVAEKLEQSEVLEGDELEEITMGLYDEIETPTLFDN